MLSICLPLHHLPSPHPSPFLIPCHFSLFPHLVYLFLTCLSPQFSSFSSPYLPSLSLSLLSFPFLSLYPPCSSSCTSLHPVWDAADQPPPHFDPIHHVCVIRGHASSGEPPQRHCLQLRPRADQRHGTTHTHTQSHMLFLHLQHQKAQEYNVSKLFYVIRGMRIFVLTLDDPKHQILIFNFQLNERLQLTFVTDNQLLFHFIFLPLFFRWKQALGWTWSAWRWWCWPSPRGGFPSSTWLSSQPGQWPGTSPGAYNHRGGGVGGKKRGRQRWGSMSVRKDNKKKTCEEDGCARS